MKRTLLLAPLLLWGCGTDVNGPAGTLLSCVYGDGTTLEVAEVRQFRGSENQTLCIDAGAPGITEFLYIPFFGARAPEDDDASLSLPLDLELTGAAAGSSSALAEPGAPLFASVAGSGAADAAAGGRGRALGPVGGKPSLPDTRFEAWLRQREIRELTPRIRAGAADAPTPSAARAMSAVAADVPTPGELLDLNVSISCSTEDIRTGRVTFVSDRAVVVADTGNPGGFSSFEYLEMASAFDTLVYPVVTGHMGEPEDIDGNGRVILFFTRAVNELTPRDASTVTLGFFWSGDLFPEVGTERLEACPAANQAEIVYLISPDPLGRVGPPFSSTEVRQRSLPLIGHELQHLVNASRRLFVNDALAFEEPWLNEGLSHITEELLFYEATGLEPAMNLTADEIIARPNGTDAFNRYMAGNAGNFRRYLERPDTASLMGIDNLATRGASWSFLRYAADRSGRSDDAFFFDLVNARDAGLDNLDRVIAGDAALSWMQDWTVSVYTDDLLNAAAAYRLPSWNFRDIYPRTQQGADYPLRVLSLATSSPLHVELLPGGAAFAQFLIPGDGQAVLRARPGGSPPGSAFRGSLVRIR
jgi:hypothetical protein